MAVGCVCVVTLPHYIVSSSSSSWTEKNFYNLGRYTCLVAFFKYAPCIVKVVFNGHGCPKSLNFLGSYVISCYVWFLVTFLPKRHWIIISSLELINEEWSFFGGFVVVVDPEEGPASNVIKAILFFDILDFRKHWSNRLSEFCNVLGPSRGLKRQAKVHLVSPQGKTLPMAAGTG